MDARIKSGHDEGVSPVEVKARLRTIFQI